MAKSLLTSKHKGTLEYLASLALEPETSVELFEADLPTGDPGRCGTKRNESKDMIVATIAAQYFVLNAI